MKPKEIYNVFMRHPHLTDQISRSYIWHCEKYKEVKNKFGKDSAQAFMWAEQVKKAAAIPSVQADANRLLRLEKAGTYLNDDGKCDCSRCRLPDCRWRGRIEKNVNCPKNSAGRWLHRPLSQI